MKTLVSAATIRDCRDRGDKSISAPRACSIVTPEARDLAAKWGITIDQAAVTPAAPTCAAADPVAQIRQQVSARLAPGTVDAGLIEQLVRKALQDMAGGAPPGGSCERKVADNGVVLVRGNTVRMGSFDGAPGRNIGLTDVITGADQARMSAGYMAWDNAFFPWTLNYDEIDVVLEGELHIRAGGKTYIGKPGDVFFIPSGASIEFGTPSSVRFVYVTYPANWAG